MHDIRDFIKEYMREHRILRRVFGARIITSKAGKKKLNVNSKCPMNRFLRSEHNIRISSLIRDLEKIGLELYVVQIPIDLSSLQRKNTHGWQLEQRPRRYPWVNAFYNSVKYNRLSCLKISKKAGYAQRQLEHMLVGERNNNWRVVKDIFETVGLIFQVREIVPNANTSGQQKNGEGVQSRHRQAVTNNVLSTHGHIGDYSREGV